MTPTSRSLWLLPLALAATAAPLAAGPAAPPPPAPPPPAPEPSPAPSPGATIFTFNGRGWGHGVGMSQYGARGRALAGWTAPQILGHYYRGARLSRIAPGSVRVLLVTSRPKLTVRSPSRWQVVVESASPRRALRLGRGDRYTIAQSDGRIELRGPKGRVRARLRAPIRFQPTVGGSHVEYAAPGRARGPRYRGSLRILAGAGGMTVVNVVSLEQYLFGVVPREVPSSWGDDSPAAVEAQAIAARTYAVSSGSAAADWDLLPDTRSQVYGGRDGEDARTTRAVRATRGRVLTYRGEVIRSFFFSTSGGRTEDVRNVFSPNARMPYLRSVPDPFDRISPLHVWKDPPSFRPERLGTLLGVGAPVTGITVLERGDSPRVKRAAITTALGRTVLTGTQMRARLGLRDTWFSVARRTVTPAQAKRLTAGS